MPQDCQKLPCERATSDSQGRIHALALDGGHAWGIWQPSRAILAAGTD